MTVSTHRLLALTTLVLVVASLLSVSPAAAAPCVTVTPDGARRCYATIQAAVDAAPNGATINLSPDTYVEQVIIRDKTLTLYGNGATVRVPSTTDLTVIYGEVFVPAIITVKGDATVDIRNLIVDGANQLEHHPGLIGIAYYHASGSVKETVVKNLSFAGPPRAPREPGYPEGIGIAAGVSEVNTFGGPYTVTIAGNTVTNYNAYGIKVIGSRASPEKEAQFRAIVRNNRTVGSGPSDQSLQSGISFFGNGVIERNTVSNHFYTGSLYGITETCGIDLSIFSNNHLNANMLVNNETGICVDAAHYDRPMTMVVDGNRISGPAAGASGYTGVRLQFVAGYTVDLRNTAFSNLALGIHSWPGMSLTQSGNTFTNVTTQRIVGE